MDSNQKHFIDSSVAQKQMFGTTAYKRALEKNIGPGPQYISDYILMEFRRTFITNAIHFCQLIDSPLYENIGDVLAVWSDKFPLSEHKAVLRLMSKVVVDEKFRDNSPTDLVKFKVSVVEIIKALDREFRTRYVRVIAGKAKCSRAFVDLDIHIDTYEGDFEQFLNAFEDVKTRRDKCDITKMLLHVKADETNKYISANNHAEAKQTKANKNFKGVALHLEAIRDKPATASCRLCCSMGDAVIALDCTPDMILEHTDSSFNQLCDIIGQPHQMHISELAFDKARKAAAAKKQAEASPDTA